MNHSSSQSTAPGFAELGIDTRILSILSQKKIAEPTPIQHQAIPTALQGKDIIGIAQTGTGKTWAFGIPMLQRLAQHGGRGLIVVPTRELAYQAEESLSQFARALGIRTTVIVGGASMGQQKSAIRANPRIVIATPGRLNDHLQQRTITLKEVKILVLDEADQMLDMGFKPQIEKIIAHVPKERQTLLFSATMPQEIVKLASAHMELPLRIEVAPAGTAAEKVEQELFVVQRTQKMQLLLKILEEHDGTILVFSRTKHGAKKMTRTLNEAGHTAAEIHANRSLAQRRAALDGFKRGTYRILVATDIAARGIDVTGITLVINYDLPDDAADYVHRIGRTGRAGKAGLAISFATPEQASNIRNIEKLIRAPLPRKHLPGTLPPPPLQKAGTERDQSTKTFRPRNSYARSPKNNHRLRRGRRGGRRSK